MDLRERCVFISRSGSPEFRLAERVVWHPPEMTDPLSIVVPDLFLP